MTACHAHPDRPATHVLARRTGMPDGPVHLCRACVGVLRGAPTADAEDLAVLISELPA